MILPRAHRLIQVVLIGASVIAPCQSQVVHFGEDSFDKATFSQLPVLQARRECLDALTGRMDRIEQSIELNGTQSEKLQAAGEVDVHRFFSEYAAFKRGIRFGNVARDQWQQLSIESRAAAKPFTKRFHNGLHGDGSLFHASLIGMVDQSELDAIERTDSQAARGRYAEQIDSALLVVGREVAITVERRDEIKRLLLLKTEPPTLFGTSLMPLYFVLSKLGELENDMRPLFSDQDWPAVKKLIDAGITATK